MVEVEVLL